jgi:hypothetical protein
LEQLHGEGGETDARLSPEEQFSLTEIRQILESMIDALPPNYRVVEIMRDVEEMSVAETAERLRISQENVKIRLHRARRLLRKRLYELFGRKVSDVFRFHLSRCDRVVHAVSSGVFDSRVREKLLVSSLPGMLAQGDGQYHDSQIFVAQQ